MKKITAIILSLAMVISMIPAISAAGETDGVIEYVFNAGAYGSNVDIPAYSLNSGRQLVENTNDDTTKKYTHGQVLSPAYVEPNGTTAPVTLETLDYTDTFASEGTNEWRMTAQYNVADDSKLSTCNSLILSTEGLKWRCNKNRAYPTALIILKVPEGTEGEYTPKVTYNATNTGYDASFFLIPESAMTRTYESGGKTNTIDLHGKSYIESREFAEVKWHYGADKANGTEDDYSYKQAKSNVDLYRALNTSYGYYCFTQAEKEQYLLGKVDMNEETPDEDEENAELSPVTLNEGTYYLFVTYDGTLNASSARNITLCSLAFTQVSAQEKAEAAFDYAESDHTGTGKASITAYAVYGTDGEVVGTQTIENMPSVTYGEVCESITAPDAPAGYKFLYWAKGMTMGKKQVVSYSATIPEYRPHEGVNYLIAVYEKVGANANIVEFYNANGQLLDLTLTPENKLPALPSMAGYGKAVKWALRNVDGTYTEYEAGADASNLSGVFMAKYNDLKKDIAVTVNGGEPTYYAYGDPVSCTTDAANFSYWTKTVNGKTEIVSTKKEYTFNAYEKCTVNAVCNGTVDLGKTMRKIILSTFTAGEETAIMAEFIGFEDALEKGIMFDNQKLAMTTDKTQFTVINDLDDITTVTGYAIINDNGTKKKITDAEITVGAE